jgi:parallel beta-helix repeat protein
MKTDKHLTLIHTLTAFGALLLILILVAGHAWATDYYVSPTGDDADPGTFDLPFRTVQRGADAAQAGDNVIIFAGTCVENVVMNNSGTDEDHRISFLPYGDGEVIIDAVIGIGLYIPRGSDYIRVDGLTFINGHEAYGNGAGIRAIGDHGLFTNNVFHDNKHGIMISGWSEGVGQPIYNTQYNEVAYNIAYDNEASGIWVKHGDYTKIHHNTVYGNSTLWEEKGAVTFYCGEGNEVYNNTLYANLERGIHIYNGTNPCPSPDSRVFNNIVVATDSEDEVFAVDELIAADPSGEFHHNLWYSLVGEPLFAWGYDETHQGGSTLTFTQYLQTASALNPANGVGDLVADPLLLDPPSQNYALAWGSPAIDAGEYDPAMTDPDGTRPDLGRYYFDQSGSGEISVTADPESQPVTIPAGGGTFNYSVTLENTTGQEITFDAWVDVTLPEGGHFGPLLTPRSVTLGPGTSVSRTLMQTVPSGAAGGLYTLNVYAGFPDGSLFYGSDHFDFEKEISTGADLNEAVWLQDDFPAFTASEPVKTGGEKSVEVIHVAPQPFNPTATLSFQLKEESFVRIDVYDIRGNRLVTLENGRKNAGRHEVTVDGSGWVSGLYLYRLRTEDTMIEGKLILMK